MRENTDQNNSEYGHFLRSAHLLAIKSLSWVKIARAVTTNKKNLLEITLKTFHRGPRSLTTGWEKAD